MNGREQLSDSSNVWVGHHIYAPFRIVAVETGSDVGEIPRIGREAWGLENDTGHRVNMIHGIERKYIFVQTLVDLTSSNLRHSFSFEPSA